MADQKLGVSAVIVNYESDGLLAECVSSLRSQDLPIQVVVVDNGSMDGSLATAVRCFPEVESVRPPRNLGFAGGVNVGVHYARYEHLLILNPDVKLLDGCVAALVRCLQDPEVGVAGPRVQLMSSDITEYGSTIDVLGHPISLSAPGRPLFVSGCALATPRRVFERLGGFDERFFMFMEDVDYCWRALLCGFDVRVASEAFALHEGGGSTPGGYERSTGFTTTTFRISLRERNTLAMLVKCYGPSAAVGFGAVYVLQTLGAAIVFGFSGRRRTARHIIQGLVWNAREIPQTLRRRRRIQSERTIPDKVIRARMCRQLIKSRAFFRSGVPRVVEEERPADTHV